MIAIKKVQFVGLLVILGLTLTFTSCEKEELTATINTSQNTASGDIKGNGGAATKTWTFTNSSSRIGWDMSIDASSGSFQLVLEDASGAVVLNKTLTAGSGPQSADGTTPEGGTEGEWTATITLTNFYGSGDYSFR